MESDERRARSSASHDERREGLLHRIEEKLNRLLGQDDDWHYRRWVPEDSPFAGYSPGDPAPRLFWEARADAPAWDPSLAGPRFDRIDVGSVGTHGVDPRSSFDGAETSAISPHSSAREYYLLMRAQEEAQGRAGDYACYRRRKMRELDGEYATYRREQQDRFDRDFHAWREKRRGPSPQVQEPIRTEPSADTSGKQSQ